RGWWEWRRTGGGLSASGPTAKQCEEGQGGAGGSGSNWPGVIGWLRHQRLIALTASHPRAAIHTSVASKATASRAIQSHPDRCSGAGVLVELVGSTTSGRSM